MLHETSDGWGVGRVLDLGRLELTYASRALDGVLVANDTGCVLRLEDALT